MSVATITLPPVYGGFYRLSVDKYHRMLDAGILDDGEKIELLEGYLVPKMSHNPSTAGSLDRTRRRIERVLPVGYLTRGQLPITLTESEPEPDIVVARGQESDFDARHPGPADLALLVEVANSSLTFDRDHKARIYARAGIGEYWIVNVVDRQIEVYTLPSGPTAAPSYAQRRDYLLGQSVPLVLDGVSVGQIDVSEVVV